MNTIKKYFVEAFVFLFLAGAISSCTSMDEGYKDFIKNGEISYTGKIDSLHIYSGKNRVKVEGLIISDPKVSEVRVFWNNRKDSVVELINRTAGIDKLSIIIPNLTENIYNFEVITYDKLGNSSVSVSKVGTTYGMRYEATLLATIMNRKVVNADVNGANANLTLDGLNDFTKNSVYTKVTYTATDNLKKEVLVLPSQTSVSISDYKTGSDFDYSTAYKPNSGSIDVFYTPEVFFGVPTEVTSTYLSNFGFETSPTGAATDNYIYDVPNWTESPVTGTLTYYKLGTINYGSTTTPFGIAPAANAKGGTALLGVKLHWSPNSELYIEQTITLPAGKYTLQWESIIKQTVANGSSLMGYVIDGVGIYSPFPAAVDTWKNNNLLFELSGSKTVKIRMGYKKTADKGGAESPILFVDNIKLLYAKNSR